MPIFNNITVLDLTRVLSGPLATRHFADQGAKVIKIEPIDGDDARDFPPLINGWSGYFEIFNRNKKSLVLNLKSKEGLNKFYKLCKTADVVVENFSSPIKTKLKIDYNTVKKINPKIIYASLSGISSDNPRKYYDIIAQSESGLTSLNNCQVNRSAIIDAFAGMKLAFAISSSLYHREISSQGMEINVSMLGCGLDLLEQNLLQASITKQNPDTTFDTAICPFGLFHTASNDITIAIGNQQQWQVFVKLMCDLGSQFQFEQYSSNQIRLDNRQLINTEIQKALIQSHANELQARMESLNIPSAVVATMLDVLGNSDNYAEQLLQRVFVENVDEITVPTGGIKFVNYPAVAYQQAPKLNDYDL